MAEKIRFGIIGCGVIAPWHVAGISRASNAELVAVCDVIPEKADKLAGESGAAKVYTDHRHVLDDPEVDAVCICTPSGLHAKIGIQAAQAGKHILSEKPLDITLQAIDDLIETAHTNSVKLGCIFQRRTEPVWIAIRDAVQSGALGKLILADAYLKYYRSQQYYDSAGWRGTWELDGGGALMNQGVHCVDLMRWIVGEPLSVFARCDHLVRNIDVEDTACAVVTYNNGAMGVIQGTTSVWKGMEHRLEFHGETGNILVRGESIVHWETEDGSQPPSFDSAGEGGSASANPQDIATEGHFQQITDFADSILNDHDPMVTGEDARGAVELILGIYKSAKMEEVVKFPL